VPTTATQLVEGDRLKRLSESDARYWVPVILIFLGSCLRVFVCFQHNPMNYLWSDPLAHWIEGTHFPKGGYVGAANPILYQVYIFFLHKVTGDNKLAIALASAVLSVLMPWTFYRAARNFGVGKAAALWVWVLIAWTPSLLTIYHYIMMETLLLLLEGAALWMTARYLRKGGTEAFLTAVLFWTLACLTKQTVILLAATCLFWGWWKKRPSLRALGAAAVMVFVLLLPQALRTEIALGFVAPLGNPWLTRIQHRSGTKILWVDFYTHSNSHFHLQMLPHYMMYFGSPSVEVCPLSPFSSWMMRRAAGDSKLTITIDSAYGERDWKRAYEALHVSSSEWLAQWRENIIFFFFAPSWPESSVPEWDGKLEYEARWFWAPLIVLVFVWNLRAFVHRRFDLIPVAVTLFTLFLALQNLVTFEGRYRKPLEPLLLLNLVWLLEGGSEAPELHKENMSVAATNS